MLRETVVDEAPDMAAFPVSPEQLNATAHWRARAKAEREWQASWTVRMRQALRIQREQMGR